MKGILFLFLLLPLFSNAQKMSKIEEKAEDLFFEESLFEALDLYEKIIAKDPNNKLAIYRSEICSLLTNYRNKPLDIILSYTGTQGKKDRFFKYWMGRIYLKKNKFDQAISSWDAFLKGRFYKSKEIVEEVENFILQAELIKEKYSHVNDYEIEHLPLPINSNYTEYSPVYFEDKKELLYVSSRPTDNENLKSGAFHVYFSKRLDGAWTDPELQYQFGNFTESNANIEVVNNDGKLFLYEDDNQGLYYSELENGLWADMKRFDSHLTGEKMESHFFINEHEDRILFAKEVKIRKSKSLDIYESIKDPVTGDWSNPYPFSLVVNSDKDEDFPYLTPDDKTLYFSSKGHGSIGGYDVFRSDYDSITLTWSEPEALHYPINTQDDDIQFKIYDDFKSGYFVSDRLESKGDADIFFFYNEPKILLHGDIIDTEGNGIANAKIIFTSYNSKDAVVSVEADVEGYYRAKLDESHRFHVRIESGGKVIHKDESTTSAKSVRVEKRQDFMVIGGFTVKAEKYDSAQASFTSIKNLGSKFRRSKKAKLDNTYFDSGSYKITNDSEKSLDGLYHILKEFPNLKLQINGHTDNVGSHDVNMFFSLKRAQAVVGYLVGKKINPSRLIAKGFGETQPLASNDDEVDGRELNRRIEVIVIE